MKEKLISIFKYLFFLLLGLALLFLAFKNIDVNDVWQELKQANYSWILGSMFFALLSHYFRAKRWNQLINQMKYKTSTTTTFYAVMIGYLANLALPRMGEVSRCVVLSKKENIPFNVLFGSVIAERVFDLVILILIIVAVFLAQIDRIGGFLNQILIKPLLGSYTTSLEAILIILGGSVLLVALGIFVFKKLKPWFKTTMLYEKVDAFLNGFIDGLKSIAEIEQRALFLFNTFMIWVLYLAMIILPFYSFEETSMLDIVDGMTVLAIGSLGIIAPVPGGIGSYHFIITELFTQLYNIPAQAAVAYATANHAAQTLLILITGGISYILLFINKRKPLNELPKENKK
ncbi:MAG: flippase-like domain-containing protein [Bacteroidales bacterium]|nr:flippase-like domain-containing protein [Bacteroidales bacterium]